MSGETIGDSKCQCIMPFYKYHIIRAIEESITRQEKEIKRVYDRAEEIRKNELLTPEELLELYNNKKNDLSIVWKRVSETPECK